MTLSLARKVKAARAWLKWSQEDLARASGVGVSTIRDFERQARETHWETVDKICAPIFDAGIVFYPNGIFSNKDGQGVLLGPN